MCELCGNKYNVLSFQRTAQTQEKGARQRVGKVEDKQLVENGDIVQRSTCTCNMSFLTCCKNTEIYAHKEAILSLFLEICMLTCVFYNKFKIN